MGKKVITRSWQSIHTDYLRFAVLSLQDCKKSASELTRDIYLNRNLIDTIRYSYDCLEASTEFIYHMGTLKQLPKSIQDNWLSRNLQRKWNNLALSDRIGILAYAWMGQTFWRSDDQYKLFEELKRVRDGLTHPVPFGTELEEEILFQQEYKDGTGFTKSRAIGEPKQIGLVKKGIVAKFNQNPYLLEDADAEKALEILLCHLSRLEKTFFGRVTTWFAFHETKSSKLLSTKDLLGKVNRRFESIWESA